ncbi:carboxypeptidase M32 [Arachidicoccus soli]|uniref:Metal-dependent carboxypeptidase n=1 Tax=Arachidicoccus soli TaxID=2341117 RepID=A0A386HRP3_9BACT|nr:carboxypeptidase M32 [Arachidicoccus soli]AYD48628.1 carboxypeptidase M32 [Arachidicoccus soli]
MANTIQDLYQKYLATSHQIADIRYATAVLEWDQETYLPSKGAAARSRQLATLSEMAHKLSTEKVYGDIIEELLATGRLTGKELINVELSKENFDRQKKIPSKFVRELSESISGAYHLWIEARRKNDYDIFEPALNRLVKLKQQEAELLGYENHPYDALLKDYEKSASVKMLDNLFEAMTAPLKELLKKVLERGSVNDDFLRQFYPKQKQWDWGIYLIKELGFDFEAGRQDISEHPFTTNFSALDVRITTRIDEHDFANMNWSCIHETGHALYEQGLPYEDYGLPSGEYASLSIHESQSRFWENCIGRSKEFWQYYYPELQKHFPEQLGNISLNDFGKAINKVEPSLIRTEADELTYHFHIKIRYIIDKELIGGTLSTKNLRERWSELYKEYLNVIVQDDNTGCLQDVHWSHGSFGYFPTYSLGSFYAAQFWEKIKEDQPNALIDVQNGNLKDILAWLRKNIHSRGQQCKSSEALCEKVTGKPLHTDAFLRYLNEKLL